MKKGIILTGAGLSAESGLKTFRGGKSALWDDKELSKLISIEGFALEREKVLNFYDQRRAQLTEVEPNYAHIQLANFLNETPNLYYFTQNVDDLFERAGGKNVIHLHGELTKAICEHCKNEQYIGYKKTQHVFCNSCKSMDMRHGVVMFGEAAPRYYDFYETFEIYSPLDIFVAIGTSGTVIDVEGIIEHYRPKISILANLDREFIKDPDIFDHIIEGKITETVDKVINIIKESF